jgi:hypothetical protein
MPGIDVDLDFDFGGCGEGAELETVATRLVAQLLKRARLGGHDF